MEPADLKPIKLGVKIERPSFVSIHALYPILAGLAFLLIGATLWLLALEYLGEPPPVWLKALLNDFVLSL